ncbi:MAG: hypothetical protein IPK44_23475 [Candidatus Accumulibacter sp.]|uniref:hypothetical protein n=1 Tax=Accumulibacter sp. TaxID=2053492 RepID=UPI00258FCBA5|nr:hypothetical protein [Accumulibacter sp.]MBK8117254.1 hypothetical protein [Accumulibacter sp.]
MAETMIKAHGWCKRNGQSRFCDNGSSGEYHVALHDATRDSADPEDGLSQFGQVGYAKATRIVDNNGWN